MSIPTEPIGSVPRTEKLIQGIKDHAAGKISAEDLDALYDEATRETILGFEETGSPVIADGEQKKPSFLTYPVHGLPNFAADGMKVPFADGHERQWPRLTEGPFRYGITADQYLEAAQKHASRPLKQAVISASALSLFYPEKEIPGYSRDEYIEDMLEGHEAEIRRCLELGAHNVQIDFTEGRLTMKLDPSGQLLDDLVEVNNRGLDRFTAEERQRIGIHTCPGSDLDSTHSADVDYAEVLPKLFQIKTGRFYIQLASEPDRPRVLQIIKEHSHPEQMIFVGVIDPIDPRVETAEEVRDRVLEAAKYIPLERLGTTDDCGFSPFGDDMGTARKLAFDKIRARLEGTRLAAKALGV